MRMRLTIGILASIILVSIAFASEKKPTIWDTETFNKATGPLLELFREKKYEEVVGPLDSLYSHAPLTLSQRTICESYLGRAYFHLEEYQKSLEYLAKAWESNPSDIEIYFYALAARFKTRNIKQTRRMLYDYFKTGTKDVAPIVVLAGPEIFEHPALRLLADAFAEEVKVDLDERSFMGVSLGTSRKEMAKILKGSLDEIPRDRLVSMGRYGSYWEFELDDKERVSKITVHLDLCDQYTIQRPRISHKLTVESTIADVQATFGKPTAVLTEGRRLQYVDGKGTLTFVFGGSGLLALSHLGSKPEERLLSGITMEVGTLPAPDSTKPESTEGKEEVPAQVDTVHDAAE
jgi:hypothetical protein